MQEKDLVTYQQSRNKVQQLIRAGVNTKTTRMSPNMKPGRLVRQNCVKRMDLNVKHSHSADSPNLNASLRVPKSSRVT